MIPLQIIRALAFIIYSCFSLLSQTTPLKTIANDLCKFHFPSQSDKNATISNIHVEGTLSQICILGITFYFMPKNGQLFVIFL